MIGGAKKVCSTSKKVTIAFLDIGLRGVNVTELAENAVRERVAEGIAVFETTIGSLRERNVWMSSLRKVRDYLARTERPSGPVMLGSKRVAISTYYDSDAGARDLNDLTKAASKLEYMTGVLRGHSEASRKE